MKIVVDTNLFVAGYFNKESASAKILKMIKESKIQILWTEKIKKEVEKVIRDIKAGERFQKEIKKIFREENKVKPKFRIREIKGDPEDNKFLEAAYFGKAEAIISNDQHLLNLKEFQNIPIFTPKNFLGKLEK
jgi:hypothetical protein